MNTYLAIITTVLVITQIIRVTQNTIQLRKYNKTDKNNDYIVSVYGKLEKWIDGKGEKQ